MSRQTEDLYRHPAEIDKTVRSRLKRQKPCVVWFTGLSGAGKSTVANLVERKLASVGNHTYLLDGDDIRHGLSRDLSFTVEDRVENIRRVAECAKLFVDAGLIVIVALISPFRQERELARRLLEDGEFVECYVNTPLAICEQRDPKGLYRKARQGALPNFTGIDSPYEPPLTPELSLDAGLRDAESLADSVIRFLQDNGYLL
jgi:bifunctional enzyme CysN/CysC